MNSADQNGYAPTLQKSLTKGSKTQRRLTQKELEAWWPFSRLDPKLFPQKTKQIDEYEDALL